jgi:hypothetical protein
MRRRSVGVLRDRRRAEGRDLLGWAGPRPRAGVKGLAFSGLGALLEADVAFASGESSALTEGVGGARAPAGDGEPLHCGQVPCGTVCDRVRELTCRPWLLLDPEWAGGLSRFLGR